MRLKTALNAVIVFLVSHSVFANNTVTPAVSPAHCSVYSDGRNFAVLMNGLVVPGSVLRSDDNYVGRNGFAEHISSTLGPLQKLGLCQSNNTVHCSMDYINGEIALMMSGKLLAAVDVDYVANARSPLHVSVYALDGLVAKAQGRERNRDKVVCELNPAANLCGIEKLSENRFRFRIGRNTRIEFGPHELDRYSEIVEELQVDKQSANGLGYCTRVGLTKRQIWDEQCKIDVTKYNCSMRD